MPRSCVFAIPGDITTPTGGYAYDRAVLNELATHGWDISHVSLGDSFPFPTPDHLAHAAEILLTVDSSTPVLIDGLAFGALDTATLAQVTAPLIALVHHPLAREGGVSDELRDSLFRVERDNLRYAAACIVTSPDTARLLTTDYGVDSEQITVAQPGTSRPTQPRQPTSPPLILSVGSQSHRKGHDVLLRALSDITDVSWQCRIIGSERDREYAESLAALRDSLGLADRVVLNGAVDTHALEALFGEASVFALATRYEGYGMVFAEAMAHGLPIVSCATGAVPDTVAEGAGILVPVDDAGAVATALRRVLEDQALAGDMSRAAWRAADDLPRWEDTASIVGGVISRVASGGGEGPQ